MIRPYFLKIRFKSRFVLLITTEETENVTKKGSQKWQNADLIRLVSYLFIATNFFFLYLWTYNFFFSKSAKVVYLEALKLLQEMAK